MDYRAALAVLLAFSTALAPIAADSAVPGNAAVPCVFPTPPPAANFTSFLNLTYEHVGAESVGLDLYMPKSVAKPPIIMVIHGGGWTSGSKSQPIMAYDALTLVGQGYAAASIDYRLVHNGQDTFPAPVQDARCAVRWLKANAANYGYDPTHVGVIGFSAGAYLAVMLGTSARIGGDFDNPSCGLQKEPATVNAVAAYYAPTDFRDEAGVGLKSKQIFRQFLGENPQLNATLATHASAVSYVNGNASPFFIAHGRVDSLVPVQQQADLVDALRASKVPVEYMEIPGFGHSFDPFSRRIEADIKPSTCALLSFFRERLK